VKDELVKDRGVGGTKVGVLLVLDVTAMAKDISELSMAAIDEKEVLLLPGTQFVCDSSTPIGYDRYEVNAHQVK
jgi:hypothetical protein